MRLVAILATLCGMLGVAHPALADSSADAKSTAVVARADSILAADSILDPLFDDAELQASFVNLLPHQTPSAPSTPWQPRPNPLLVLPMMETALAATAATSTVDVAVTALLGQSVDQLRRSYAAIAAAWNMALEAQEQAVPATGTSPAVPQVQLGDATDDYVRGLLSAADPSLTDPRMPIGDARADYLQAIRIEQSGATALAKDAAHLRLAARIGLVAIRDAETGISGFPASLRGNSVVFDEPLRAGSGLDHRFGVVDAYQQSALATDLRVGWERVRLDDGAAWLDTEAASGKEVAGLLMVPDARRHVPSGLALPFDDPRNVWGQYVLAMSRQFRGRVGAWIVGNEPDIWDRSNPYFTWSGTVDDYARLVKTTYLAVKAGDPDAKVVLGGETYWWDAASGRPLYFTRLLDVLTSVPDARSHDWYFDAVALHLYSTPSDLYDVPRIYRDAMSARGLHKSVWINETNAVPWDVPGEQLPRADFRVTRDEQASYVIQALSYALAAGVERVEIYTMVDGLSQHEPFGLCNSYSCDRPASVAYRTAATFFAGAQASPPRHVDGAVTIDMQNDQYDLTVVWSADARGVTVSVPAKAPLAAVVDRTGTAWTLHPVGGVYRLTLSGATANTAPGRPNYYAVGGAPLILLQPREPSPGSPR